MWLTQSNIIALQRRWTGDVLIAIYLVLKISNYVRYVKDAYAVKDVVAIYQMIFFGEQQIVVK